MREKVEVQEAYNEVLGGMAVDMRTTDEEIKKALVPNVDADEALNKLKDKLGMTETETK